MSADPRKPRVFYHGTAEILSRIEPKPAHGVGPEHDKLEAVYATHLRNLAIAFSLPITPNEDGGFILVWRFRMIWMKTPSPESICMWVRST